MLPVDYANPAIIAVENNDLSFLQTYFAKLNDEQLPRDIAAVTAIDRYYQQFRAAKYAAYRGRLDMLAWLASAMPRPSLLGPDDGASILSDAVSGSQAEVIYWLVDQGWVRGNDSMLIIWTVTRGDLDFLRRLVTDYRANVCVLRGIAVDIAASHNHIHMLAWILDNTAYCEVFPLDSAMRSAVQSGHLSVVQYLHGRQPSLANMALCHAAMCGTITIVAWLVEEAGADIHYMRDKPLNDAVCGGHVRAVQYLISKGADPDNITAQTLERIYMLYSPLLMFAAIAEKGHQQVPVATIENVPVLTECCASSDAVCVVCRDDDGAHPVRIRGCLRTTTRRECRIPVHDDCLRQWMSACPSRCIYCR